MSAPEIIPRPFALAGPVPAPPPGQSWEGLMDAALDLARLGAAKGEIPVGALVVDAAGRIAGQAHNECVARHDPSAHAEMLALRRAGRHAGNYRLEGMFLIATLEPCLMCAGALVHARVAGLVFGAADAAAGSIVSRLEGLALPQHNHRPWHMGGVRSGECAAVLRVFFEARR